jgi:hypothetical protein
MSSSRNIRRRYRVEIFFPVVDEEVHRAARATTSEAMAIQFGGCTIFDHLEGLYHSATGLIVHDRITLIVTDTPPLSPHNVGKLRAALVDFQQRVAVALGQEELLITLSQVEHI